MKNFFLFKRHMKKSCNIGLSLLLFFLFFSSCGNKKNVDVYKKEKLVPNDSIKYESIKIQTH